jgi:hypothetical protein
VRRGVLLDFKPEYRPFRIREGREFAGRDQAADEVPRTAQDSRRDSQRDGWSTALSDLDRRAAEIRMSVSTASFEFATINRTKNCPLADAQHLGSIGARDPTVLIG